MGLGHQWRHSVLQADEKEIDRKEDRRTHGHRRQIDGRKTTGHDRIDKAHGRLRQLGQQQGAGQAQERDDFVAKKGKGAHREINGSKKKETGKSCQGRRLRGHGGLPPLMVVRAAVPEEPIKDTPIALV
jgi:hypothetical protein